jgi:hypothetical protein
VARAPLPHRWIRARVWAALLLATLAVSIGGSWAAAPVLAAPGGGVDGFVYDMYGPPHRTDGTLKGGVRIGAAPWGRHEALPLGLPSNFDFYHGARPGTFGPPGSGRATSSWGQVFEAAPGTGTYDVRVQVRDHRLFFLLRDGRWVERRADVDDRLIEGGYWSGTFRPQATAAVRDESGNGGGSSASLAGLAARDHATLHFWWRGWYPREVIPADAVGMLSMAEMRLIPDRNPAVDLGRARFIASIGADNYASATHTAGGQVVTAVMQPRMKLLTDQWRTFSGTTLTEAQLRANPPPAPQLLRPGSRTAVSGARAAGSAGVWVGFSDGTVRGLGTAPVHGQAVALGLNAPVVAMAPTSDGGGYWLLGRDGGVFSYGNARFHGSTGGLRLNQPVVALAAHPAGTGYWFTASDGGVFSFGLPFHGSAAGLRLNQPVVGMAPTQSGRGYWLVAADGGIFSFGDARFAGSTGGMRLNQPIVAMAADPDGGGYWLVAADGGVFAFDATFHGSGVGRLTPGDRVVDLIAHADGGYWMVTRSGSVLGFGAARGVDGTS